MEQPQTEEDEDSRCVILALGDSKSLKAAYKLEKLTNGIETELFSMVCMKGKQTRRSAETSLTKPSQP
jgi:hypothetical protein